MIPHPSCWFDNPDTRPQEMTMWKKILAWILKLAPGVVEAVMEQKAKDAAKPKPPSA